MTGKMEQLRSEVVGMAITMLPHPRKAQFKDETVRIIHERSEWEVDFILLNDEWNEIEVREIGVIED